VVRPEAPVDLLQEVEGAQASQLVKRHVYDQVVHQALQELDLDYGEGVIGVINH